MEDVLRVATGVLGDDDAELELTNQPPAAFVLRVASVEIDDDVAEILVSFLRDTAAAGVRAILESSEHPEAQSFGFLGAPGGGFGDGFFTSADE